MSEEFVLPEYWVINREGYGDVCDWFNQNNQSANPNADFNTKLIGWFAHWPRFENNHTASYINPGYKEITYEQFKEHVMKDPQLELSLKDIIRENLDYLAELCERRNLC